MASLRTERLQRLWRNIHLWLGAGLFVLLAPIAISGALLVWKEPLDARINPGRYAVSAGPLQSPSLYIGSAMRAAGEGLLALSVRYPGSAGGPVTVTARGAGERGTRFRLMTVYLDPPTGRVLDVAEFRSSFIGTLHRFHENLTIPEYYGRAIVG